MIVASLKTILNRDLLKLKQEISLYTKEENLWRIEKDIANSAGNLCLHLVGNINAYIGAELGKTGYIRQRDLEFSLKNIPQKELISKIEQTIEMVNSVLSTLSDGDLEKDFPVIVLGEKTSTGFFLIHLATHLDYHLGQVNYHRRLIDSTKQ